MTVSHMLRYKIIYRNVKYCVPVFLASRQTSVIGKWCFAEGRDIPF